jgi:hypothetical protein
MARNIFPNRFTLSSTGGIRVGGTSGTTRYDFDGGLNWRRSQFGDVMEIEENAMPDGVPRMTRAAAETTFPNQYNPSALWQPIGNNPWGWKAVSQDPYACDLELDVTSPLKGICSDGTDPGVNWSVLQTAIDGVRNYNPEDIVFPNSVGIVVDFV